MSTFRHRRDWRNVRTDVLVQGIGSDGTGLPPGTPTTAWPVVYARYQSHTGDYPCEYIPNGWGGKPYFDARIVTIAQATAIAAAIGDRVWGAIGTITFQTDGQAEGTSTITHFQEGDLIRLYDPAEGQNTVYPVRSVQEVAGTSGLWQLTVGDQEPDVADLIRGGTTVNPVQTPVGGGGGGSTGAQLGTHGVPGAPPPIPIERTPIHSQQNVMRAAYTTVTAQTYRQATQLPPGSDPSAPPVAANALEYKDALGNLQEWQAPDHTNHPVRLAFHFAALTDKPSWLADDWARFTQVQVSSDQVDVAVSVMRAGVTNTALCPDVYRPSTTLDANGVPGPPVLLTDHSGQVLVLYEGDTLYPTLTLRSGATFPAAGVGVTFTERVPRSAVPL